MVHVALYRSIYHVKHLNYKLLVLVRAESLPTSLFFVNRVLTLRPNLMTEVVKH